MEDGFYRILPGFSMLIDVWRNLSAETNIWDEEDWDGVWDLSVKTTILEIDEPLVIKFISGQNELLNNFKSLKIISGKDSIWRFYDFISHENWEGKFDTFIEDEIHFKINDVTEIKTEHLEEYKMDFKNFTDLDTDIMQDLF